MPPDTPSRDRFPPRVKRTQPRHVPVRNAPGALQGAPTQTVLFGSVPTTGPPRAASPDPFSSFSFPTAQTRGASTQAGLSSPSAIGEGEYRYLLVWHAPRASEGPPTQRVLFGSLPDAGVQVAKDISLDCDVNVFKWECPLSVGTRTKLFHPARLLGGEDASHL